MTPVAQLLTEPMFLVSAVALLGAAAWSFVYLRRGAASDASPTLRMAEGQQSPAIAAAFAGSGGLRAAPPAADSAVLGAEMSEVSVPTVTFADVAGLDEAVEELREIRDYLVDPERFRSLGATLPKGVLLVGPPGTGKTLLTKALAGEAGVPFQVLSAASLVEVYVGVGPARVRKIFADARKKAPSIILLDELDAIGRTRSSHAAGGQEERESTLNQLLLEMDGFDSGGGVLVVGATNRPDVLDPALLRPGRFDRRLFVSPPDLKGRRAILGVHARGKPLGPGTDLEAIARRTAGFTGADLANVMNEAALLSGRRRKRLVGREELEEAIDRLMSGPRRPSRVISALDKQVIAYHESGHVLVAWRVARGHDVHRVSVVARGQSHGHTLSVPTEDRLLVARSELLVELAVLMGGRVAEELVFADPTTGAEDDLARASALAHKMVADYGMSDMVGLLSLGSSAEAVSAAAGVALGDLRTSPVAAEVTSEVRRLLSDAHARATAILTAHRPQLDRLAERLVSAESLDKAEIDDLLADVPREPRPSRPEYDRPRARPLQLRRSMSAS